MRRWISWLLAAALVLGIFPVTPGRAAFVDVPEAAWYAQAVDWAVAQGITKGTDLDRFSPDADCTRAQIVTFLWRWKGSPMPSYEQGLPFDDIGPDSYALTAIRWACAQGITQGTGARTFSPDETCTRAQAVSFLWRAAGEPETLGEPGFSDVSAQAYYRSAVAWAVANGITVGVGEGLFAPDEHCTRAQIVTFLFRAAAIAPTEPTPTPSPVEPTPTDPTEAVPPPSDEPTEPTEPTEPEPTLPALPPISAGYTDAAVSRDGFLAVGTGGRIDRISADGTRTSLSCPTEEDLLSVWSGDGYDLIAGRRGTLLCSTDGTQFEAATAPTQADLTGAVRYLGAFYVAGYDGGIYRSTDLRRWQDVWTGECGLIGLAGMDYGIAAVSAAGDVAFSENTRNWTYQNFNRDYEGLYPDYTFTRVVGAGQSFFVLGYETEQPNVPLMMYTEDTEVWMQRPLNMVDNESVQPEDTWRILDLGFHTDQMIASCDAGRILTLPGCVACNKSDRLAGAGDLRCLAVRETEILAAGTDFFFQVVPAYRLRQERIKAEQAREDLANGAVMIDVRTSAEREADGWIPGSLHIPVGEVASKLPELVPDVNTELIFYCKSGARAQRALETARELGYYRIYNLGGLSDWPYEVEKP